MQPDDPEEGRISCKGELSLKRGAVYNMAIIKTHDLRKKPIEPKKDEQADRKKDEASESTAERSSNDTRQASSTTSRDTPKPSSRRPRPRQQPKKPEETKKRPTARTPRPRTTQRRTPAAPKKAAPVIGIVCSFEHLPERRNHSQQYFYLYRPYVSAIHDSGGVPIIIPVGLEGRYPKRVFDLIDGLLLPGCEADVDPNSYGDVPHEKLSRVDPRKDRAEIELFNLAFNKNMPVLGLCRGIQLMNVALDGTLYQDLSSQVRMAMNHNPKFPPTEECHKIFVERGTKLQQVLGETELMVNSTHHQAVKLHGKGLIVTAKAPDGVTEGIEHPSKRWIIGVQWHPELLYRKSKIQENLFKSFIEACK